MKGTQSGSNTVLLQTLAALDKILTRFKFMYVIWQSVIALEGLMLKTNNYVGVFDCWMVRKNPKLNI